MKMKVKPATLFLYVLIALFLFFGPKMLLLGQKTPDPLEPLTPNKPKWTGMITLWNVNFVDCGTDNHNKWLEWQIQRFEKNHPGVYIEVRQMTPQRVKMYFQENVKSDILPDIIALPVYEDVFSQELLINLLPYFSQKELDKLHILARKRVIKGEKMHGVPWMMGTYALVFNQDLIQDRELLFFDEELDFTNLDSAVKALTFKKKEGKNEKQYYGFCSYSMPNSRPLLSMIYGDGGRIIDEKAYNYLIRWQQRFGTIPQGMIEFSYDDAWKLFGQQGRVGIMLGSSKVIYQMRKLQQSGKGFDILVRQVPLEGRKGLFSDQVASFGILKSDNNYKQELCVSFLKGLLDDEAQSELKHIGAFSIKTGVGPLYAEDPEMYILEDSLSNYYYGPNDSRWLKYGESIYDEIKQKLGDVSVDS